MVSRKIQYFFFSSAGFDTDFVRKVAQNYPGRASSSPTIDVFITLMQMGTAGYKELMNERRENYKLLKDEMCKVAEKYGERVLETKNNPISIGSIVYTDLLRFHEKMIENCNFSPFFSNDFVFHW